MRRSRLMVAPLIAGAMALALTACGGGNNNKSTGKAAGGANIAPSSDQKKGGTLRVQSAESFEHLDPGQSYFQLDYGAVYAVQRPLFAFKPDNPTDAQPDLASGPADVSADGKTVTVHIKPDVKYSPPVNRAATSADVKYAIERAFTTAAPNGYATSYFGAIQGTPKSPQKHVTISGIETPDKTTIVFHLTSNFGATMVKAMSLPITAPVPEEYAKDLDSHAPSTYDTDPTKQAFTGPYMISSYSASRGITLTRNPNWDPKTDFRPAYADKITWKTGGDGGVVARQTLAGGPVLMMDSPTPDVIKQAYQKEPKQITFIPLGTRYSALNTTKAPTDNVNVRRAIIAVTNKYAMNLVRGGSLIGVPGTHFLTPGQPGFEEAGGDKGFGLDYMDTPNGNLPLAQSYLKKAGYANGKGTGTLTVVGPTEPPANKSTEVFVDSLKKLGFKVKLVSVPQDTMYSKFCNVPKNEPNICPNVGWLPDFPDGYANLWVPFNGSAITQENNSNWPQLNDAKVNQLMDKASGTTDDAQRKQAWADVDKQITEEAAAVPWQWSKDPLVQGKQVHGVVALWNADWDLAFSSVE
jgi:peptide/nickel transport system substrate-binding protein